jgi:hypothetical protein
LDGQSAITVAKELNRLLDGAAVYSDCKKWDQFWLDVLFNQCGLTPTFQLHHLPDELSDYQGEQFLAAYENIKNRGHYTEHRALDDALLIHGALVDIKFTAHLIIRDKKMSCKENHTKVYDDSSL